MRALCHTDHRRWIPFVSFFQVSIVASTAPSHLKVSFSAGYCAPKPQLSHKSEMNNMTKFDALLQASMAISFIFVFDDYIIFDRLVREYKEFLLVTHLK